MAGLIQMQETLGRDSKKGLKDYANEKTRVHMKNKEIESANKSAKTSSIATGAGAGMMIGTAGGPAGMVAGGVIGAGVGYLAYELA